MSTENEHIQPKRLKMSLEPNDTFSTPQNLKTKISVQQNTPATNKRTSTTSQKINLKQTSQLQNAQGIGKENIKNQKQM